MTYKAPVARRPATEIFIALFIWRFHAMETGNIAKRRSVVATMIELCRRSKSAGSSCWPWTAGVWTFNFPISKLASGMKGKNRRAIRRSSEDALGIHFPTCSAICHWISVISSNMKRWHDESPYIKMNWEALKEDQREVQDAEQSCNCEGRNDGISLPPFSTESKQEETNWQLCKHNSRNAENDS